MNPTTTNPISTQMSCFSYSKVK